ncbi:hypothetical protein M7I_0637 [Glarea lozoyensis 74030]|uniref:Uncharacterized protein n=1 Tax=Glarea lozoyensis (strain ATCC 74030 / MF5533) TaxID=1104152 RepID=H0EDI8_GLAL7|nr:hypothetical protein M7I_0637 [Glarea lozoyensis 74030]
MSRYDEPRSVLMRGANDIPGEMSDGEPAARWKPQLRTPKSRTEFKTDVDVGGIWKDVMNEYPDGKKDDTKKTYTWKSLCKKTKKKHYARVQGYKTPKDDEAEVVQIEYADSQHSVISKSDIESVAHTQNKESAKENSAKERDTPKIIQHKRLVEIKQDVKEYGDEDFIAVMMSNGNDGVMA